MRLRRLRDDPRTRAIGLAALLGGLVLALFLAHPIMQGFRLPVGPDGPVYTWWARHADVAGLDVVPGRPGVPAVTLLIGRILGIEAVQTVALLGPVLAVVAGLAAGALLETSLGSARLRSGIAVVLSGGFAAGLAPGWLGNLCQVVMFLAALAAFARADRSWRSVGLGAGLIAAGAIAHPVFQAIGGVILLGALLIDVPAVRAHLRRGGSLADTLPGRVIIGATGGSALAGGVLASLSSGMTPIADTSQDGFFRRVGLEAAFQQNYRERAADEALRGVGHLAVGTALGG